MDGCIAQNKWWYWSIFALLGFAGISLAATIGVNGGNDNGTRGMASTYSFAAKALSEASSGTLQSMTVYLTNNGDGDDTVRAYFYSSTGAASVARPATLVDSGNANMIVNSSTATAYTVGVTIGASISASTVYYLVFNNVGTGTARIGRDDRSVDYATGDTIIYVADPLPIATSFPAATYDGNENPVACYATYTAATGASKKVGGVILGNVKL